MSPTMEQRRVTHAERRTTEEVMAALAKKYAAPQYAFLQQVGNGTGFTADRWADALAMGLWPSRGIDLHGFEVKCFRSDWLRELKNPAKADGFATLCDYWWIVIGNADVAKVEELPASWGLMLLKGRGLTVLKAAERIEAQPLDRLTFAAMLRRQTENSVPKLAVDTLKQEALDRGRELGALEATRGDRRANEEHEQLREAVDAFERASGVKIESWRGRQLGEQFVLAQALTELDGSWILGGVENTLEHALERVREHREKIKAAKEGTACKTT